MKFYLGKDCIGAVNLLERSAAADQLGNQLLQCPGALFRRIFRQRIGPRGLYRVI